MAVLSVVQPLEEGAVASGVGVNTERCYGREETGLPSSTAAEETGVQKQKSENRKNYLSGAEIFPTLVGLVAFWPERLENLTGRRLSLLQGSEWFIKWNPNSNSDGLIVIVVIVIIKTGSYFATFNALTFQSHFVYVTPFYASGL